MGSEQVTIFFGMFLFSFFSLEVIGVSQGRGAMYCNLKNTVNGRGNNWFCLSVVFSPSPKAAGVLRITEYNVRITAQTHSTGCFFCVVFFCFVSCVCIL